MTSKKLKARAKNIAKHKIEPVVQQITSIRTLGWVIRKLSLFLQSFCAKSARVFELINRYNSYSRRIDQKVHLRQSFSITVNYFKSLKAVTDNLPYRPKISVLMPIYKVKIEYLKEAIDSVVAQVYENWEICATDDCSNDPVISNMLNSYKEKYPERFRFTTHLENRHISHASNSCLQLAEGDYIALLDHDDRLYPNALGEMVRYINLHQGPEVLYSDEEVIDSTGEIASIPFFKPDFSPNLHLAVNYTTHLSLYNRALIERIGGFRPGFEGSQDHDLMLRATEATTKPIVHVPFYLYQWRAHEQSTAGSLDSKPYAAHAGVKAVQEAIVRRGRPGLVRWETTTCHYRVTYDIKTPHPLVTIIIPTKNGFDYLSKCVNSILQKTSYQNYEIIIVNHDTTEPRCLDLFDSLVSGHSNIRILPISGPFNFAKFNNLGAREARGEYLILLNNDTEVIEPDWIQEMLGLAQWPEIGAVGGKLLYSDGTIQHGGIILMDRQLAGHKGALLEDGDDMYINILNTIHEVFGVTGACLMISREKYLKVGGLDEVWVPNGWGDVHFAIKLREAGYSSVYTPYAKLYHHESPTRGANLEYFERFYLIEKYGNHFLNDPYLNPNLMRQGDMAPNPDYLGLELYKSYFDFFLTHDKVEWTKDKFLKFLDEKLA